MFSLVGYLRMAQKFLVIGLLTAIMLMVPLFIYVKTRLSDIDSAQQEVAGMEPLKTMLRLTQLTQEHRDLASKTLAGPNPPSDLRSAKELEVKQAIDDAQIIVKALDDRTLNDSFARISGDWPGIAAALGRKSITDVESFERHTVLISSELDTIEDMVNYFGIALDPSAANYFLQVAVLDHMPHMIESLGQLKNLGATLLEKGSATPGDRSRLAALSVAVQASLNKTRKYVDLSTAGDSDVKAKLAEPLARAIEATNRGVSLVNEKIIGTETPNYASAKYVQDMNAIIEAEYSLMHVSFDTLQQQLSEVVSSSKQQLYLSLFFVILCYGTTTWVMVAVTKTTLNSVRQALTLARAVAEGDLSQSTQQNHRDELGQLLRTLVSMQQSLSLVVSTVRSGADEVADASAQIAQGNNEMSGRTEGQASSLEETTTSMRELGVTVSQNAESARQANELAQQASNIAIRGGKVVAEVVDTMRGISDSSRRIADIIGVIDSIAFQTNILALNAAVEAARAGEQGRGFAVVATEVRALAGRSAKAAKEIKSLIGDSVERVEHGTTLVDQAGSTMQEVVNAIQKVTMLMGEISFASVEQSNSVQQVCTAVEKMDQAIQQNAALVEQMAAAASALKLQAHDLVKVVAKFRLHEKDAQPPQPFN